VRRKPANRGGTAEDFLSSSCGWKVFCLSSKKPKTINHEKHEIHKKGKSKEPNKIFKRLLLDYLNFLFRDFRVFRGEKGFIKKEQR